MADLFLFLPSGRSLGAFGVFDLPELLWAGASPQPKMHRLGQSTHLAGYDNKLSTSAANLHILASALIFVPARVKITSHSIHRGPERNAEIVEISLLFRPPPFSSPWDWSFLQPSNNDVALLIELDCCPTAYAI